MSAYSIWVVEYAHAPEFPISTQVAGRPNSGTTRAPYCYSVIHGEGHLAVVDTGYNAADFGGILAERYGVIGWQGPDVVLGRLGFSPDEVDTVVLTHNHFDHAGNVDAFPNARVYIQEREIANYLWAHQLPERMHWMLNATDPDLMLSLVTCLKENRLEVVRGDREVMPGLSLIAAHETHTIGSQYVTIANDHDGHWVIAGDNCYGFANFEEAADGGMFRPIGVLQGSIQRCIVLMEEMWQFAGGELTRIVPYHEARVWESFPTRTYEDQSHIAELSLAPGEPSRVGPTA